jgi:hypothetical protein
MATFIKRYEGIDVYNDWLKGNNYGHHPEEEHLKQKKTLAPRPTWKELSVYSE